MPAPVGTGIGDAVIRAATQTATAVGASALVAYTLSGTTGLRAARERPAQPILGITSRIETARRLALSYAVHAVHAPEDIHSFGEMVNNAVRIAVREDWAPRQPARHRRRRALRAARNDKHPAHYRDRRYRSARKVRRGGLMAMPPGRVHPGAAAWRHRRVPA